MKHYSQLSPRTLEDCTSFSYKYHCHCHHQSAPGTTLNSKLYENWRDIASGRTTQKTPLPNVFPLLRGAAA
jgi:hypothetical protein